MRVYGELVLGRFAKKHAAARKPLQRFLAILRGADWPHLSAVKQSFASVDYAPSTGTLVFNIGGNKYRVVASVDFSEQAIDIRAVMTHQEYDRERL